LSVTYYTFEAHRREQLAAVPLHKGKALLTVFLFQIGSFFVALDLRSCQRLPILQLSQRLRNNVLRASSAQRKIGMSAVLLFHRWMKKLAIEQTS